MLDVLYLNSPRASQKNLLYRQVREGGEDRCASAYDLILCFLHGLTSLQWVRAGPRDFLYFKPKEVVAAIVTCGGLCPG